MLENTEHMQLSFVVFHDAATHNYYKVARKKTEEVEVGREGGVGWQ